jgi:hypothetical protein
LEKLPYANRSTVQPLMGKIKQLVSDFDSRLSKRKKKLDDSVKLHRLTAAVSGWVGEGEGRLQEGRGMPQREEGEVGWHDQAGACLQSGQVGWHSQVRLGRACSQVRWGGTVRSGWGVLTVRSGGVCLQSGQVGCAYSQVCLQSGQLGWHKSGQLGCAYSQVRWGGWSVHFPLPPLRLWTGVLRAPPSSLVQMSSPPVPMRPNVNTCRRSWTST